MTPFIRTISYCVLLLAAACSSEQPEPVQQETPPPAPGGMRPDLVATNAFYYYRDVEDAWVFYRDTLGLETVVDYGFAKIMRLADSSYVTLVDAAEGMHSADEPKLVTLQLVTDTLNLWHTHFLRLGTPIEYEGAGPASGIPDRFVVRDTDGYALRFVRYNPHPNTESFVDAFTYVPPLPSSVDGDGEMSIRATAFSIYYNDASDVRGFFEGLFDTDAVGTLDGSPLYQLASSGFVLLEDFSGPGTIERGKTGMTLSLFTHDVDAWFARASAWPGLELRTDEVVDESGRVRVFVGYDPAGVFLEWDTFLDLPDNKVLFDYLKAADVY